jgi:hypothetical protein
MKLESIEAGRLFRSNFFGSKQVYCSSHLPFAKKKIISNQETGREGSLRKLSYPFDH